MAFQLIQCQKTPKILRAQKEETLTPKNHIYIIWKTKLKLGLSESELEGLGMCVSYTEVLLSPLSVKPCSPKAKLEIRRPCLLFRPVVCTVETLLCSGLVWPHLQRDKQKQFIMLQTLGERLMSIPCRWYSLQSLSAWKLDLCCFALLHWDIALSIFINILRYKQRHDNFRYGATNTQDANDSKSEGKPASARVATSDATVESWERFNFMQMPHSALAGWHLIWNNSTRINSHRKRVHGGVLSPRQSCIFKSDQSANIPGGCKISERQDTAFLFLFVCVNTLIIYGIKCF